MKLLVTFFLWGVAAMLPGQSRFRTFTSPDSAFEFKYPDLLVRCTAQHQPTGGVWWTPQESCEAYSPVCDDPGIQGSSTTVCFAYPKAEFKDHPGFEAAAFSVAEVKEATTEKSCLNGSPNWALDPRGSGNSASIQHVSFKVFEISDAGMGNYLDAHVYRNFHRNSCYELSIRIATANEANFDPPIKKLTQQDRNEVKGRLEQALESFAFLK